MRHKQKTLQKLQDEYNHIIAKLETKENKKIQKNFKNNDDFNKAELAQEKTEALNDKSKPLDERFMALEKMTQDSFHIKSPDLLLMAQRAFKRLLDYQLDNVTEKPL